MYSVYKLYVIATTSLLLSFCTAGSLSAQVIADTLELEEVRVEATRIDQPLVYQPFKVEVIDFSRMELFDGQDLGQILNMESLVSIRDNGPGGQATISQRGLSPEQTQVLWEGIPINHVTLGLTDFSLLPARFFSSVEVSSGTPSSAFGGGGLAGAIYLNSDITRAPKLSITQGVGEYGTYRSGIQAKYHEGGWTFGVNGQYDYAKNNFTFYNRAYGREEQRTHNSTEQIHLMADATYEATGHRFETKIWISDSNSEIPGSVLNRSSQARQEDKASRWLSQYQTSLWGTGLTVKNYLEQASLNYFDSEINTESYTQSQRWLLSASFNTPTTYGLIWKGEVSSAISGVETNNYNEHKTRRQFSGLLNPELVVLEDRLRLYPAVRVDAYNDFGTEVSPSLGANYELISDRIFLRGQLSRNFNPPTFNALYWPQGGDPDLKPEYSTNIEVGIISQWDSPLMRSIELSTYQTEVQQGIRWYPDSEGIYTALNIEDIHVRGVELQTQSLWQLGGDIHFRWSQKGAWTRSEVASERFEGDAAVGHQMRYVPEWSYKTSLEFQKDWLRALVYYRWTSRRYITDTEDLMNALDPYQIVGVILQAQEKIGSVQLTGSVRLKNILDEQYEIIQWYPMPGRNIHFTITATYNF